MLIQRFLSVRNCTLADERGKKLQRRRKKIVASTDKCAKENDIKSKYLIRYIFFHSESIMDIVIGGCVLHRWPLFSFAFSSISILAFYLMYLTWNGRHGMVWHDKKTGNTIHSLFFSICHSSFLSYFPFSFKSHSPTLLVPKHTYKIGLTNVLGHAAMECSSTMEIITEQTHLMLISIRSQVRQQ